MSKCVYSGTFDPVTNGHMDIINRGAMLFDEMIIAVAEDNYKNVLFNAEERLALIRECTAHIPNVRVMCFTGLLMDFCREQQATAVIRGLRAVSDFEYEMQMALMNKKLNPDVETVFLMTGQQYSFISSSIIKDVASLGGDINGLVPECVANKLFAKYGI